MNEIEQIQQEIVREFDFFQDDWQAKYEYLIALGKALPFFDEKNRTPDKLIKGCQSQVWLVADIREDKVFFSADADAILPKGIVALLLRTYSGQRPEEIVTSTEKFLYDIGLQEFLSPTRANGMLAMIKQIKLYAIALKLKKS